MVLHLSFPKQDIFVPLNKNVTICFTHSVEGNCVYINNTAIYCQNKNQKPLKDYICKLIKECIDESKSMSIEVDKSSELGQLVSDLDFFK